MAADVLRTSGTSWPRPADGGGRAVLTDSDLGNWGTQQG